MKHSETASELRKPFILFSSERKFYIPEAPGEGLLKVEQCCTACIEVQGSQGYRLSLVLALASAKEEEARGAEEILITENRVLPVDVLWTLTPKPHGTHRWAPARDRR